MSGPYEPELGQLLYGNPWGEFALPDFADSLLEGLLNEIERVYWNTHQEQWDRYDDPEIPNVTFRPYFWGTDEEEVAKPNFVFGDVEIRWYKHPCRGTTSNLALTAQDWCNWFEGCLAAIRAADTSWEDTPA